MESAAFDFDWLVIGSGFGGSVSALRLAEKGYRVAVNQSPTASRAWPTPQLVFAKRFLPMGWIREIAAKKLVA